MDPFKFTVSGGNDTLLENGDPIRGWDSFMWVERYDKPGEFEFKAKLSSGLHRFLPRGTLISHADTLEVMIVESIEIDEPKGEDPTVKITGRDFSSFLEKRVVGTNQAKDASVVTPYIVASNFSWLQIRQMIRDHVDDAFTYPGDGLVDISVDSDVAGTSTILETREIKRGPLLDRVQELLKVDNLGLKTVRRNPFGAEGTANETWIIVYKGEDKSATVAFSWLDGGIEDASYLFSLKGYYNAAIVTSTYYNVVVQGIYSEYDRRYMHVDASDIDSTYSSPPADIPGEVSWLNRLRIRGEEALANHQLTNLMRAGIAPFPRFQFRKDYQLGDLVTVNGNYGTTSLLRVTEYVEIEDENGESGHPTLELP